jgi:hypothetical protein
VNAATKIIISTSVWLLLAVCGHAQCPNGAATCVPRVPRLVRFSGTLKDGMGNPRSGVVGITFSMYSDLNGGTPLWQEVQNVQLDQHGRYTVLLGTSTSGGVPVELFSSGDSRYLGVQAALPGETEEPRVLMVSVPYALKAGDAETLGGLPPSAFLRAYPNAVSQYAIDPSGAKSQAVVTTGVVAGGPTAKDTTVTAPGGTVDTIPKFATASSIVDSQITDSSNMVSLQNLANILFADRFPNGISDAIAACPSNGCTIYAGSPNTNLNLGTIDPGGKAITIYLGPYTYNVTQITLRKALKIIGMGASGGVAGSITCTASVPCNGTILQSVNGNNPVFVLPQASNSAATDVLLAGFRLLGAAGNSSEDGFFLDASSLVNSGLWHSTFTDLDIEGFAGIGIHLKGPNNNFGAISQWLHFDNVSVFRTAGGGNGLRLEGANFEMDFSNCEFDGLTAGDGTNIYIGGLAGGINGYPLNIRFTNLVTQGAAVAVQIDGAAGISFYSSHHEKLWGVYSITNNTNIGTKGVTIADANFFGVGTNNGAGYLLNVGTTLASGIVFVRNQVLGNPDSVVTGTNLSQIIYRDNLFYDHSTFNVPPTSGITTGLAPATILNIGSASTVGLTPSSTPITTIQSSLGPGEMVTFFMLSGTGTFSSGGNINLLGPNSISVNGSITFVRNDLTGQSSAWTPVAQWNPAAAAASGSFTVSVSPASVAVSPGETATFNLTVVPAGGFSGAVQLACTGAPPKSYCSAFPNPLTVEGANPVSATLGITTTAPRRNLSSEGPAKIPVGPGLPPIPGTPLGIYPLTITATSGGISQSATFNLAVQ